MPAGAGRNISLLQQHRKHVEHIFEVVNHVSTIIIIPLVHGFEIHMLLLLAEINFDRSWCRSSVRCLRRSFRIYIIILYTCNNMTCIIVLYTINNG